MLVGPRERHGWLALAALGVSWLGYILLIPDNWYSGGGAIGNRYFVNLVPLGLLLLPRAKGGWAAAAALAGAALVAPILASPVHHSLRPGEHATWAAFRVLPPELTMLGDLSVFTDVWRKRRPYNRPDEGPALRPPGSPPPYFLWFLDGGTFGQEESFGEEGFWLRGGESAQVVLQALSPAPRVRLLVTAGPAGDIVTARLGSERQRVVLPPLKTREILFSSPRAALAYYGTSLYLLRLGSRYGEPTPEDPRRLGSFVEVVLGDSTKARGHVEERSRGSGAGGLVEEQVPRARPENAYGFACLRSRGFHPPNPPRIAAIAALRSRLRLSVLSATGRRARG